jgi:hypothetical protein
MFNGRKVDQTGQSVDISSGRHRRENKSYKPLWIHDCIMIADQKGRE